MSEGEVKEIEIIKEVPFFGSGDSVESRLRKVSLRGFPDVKVYENARFAVSFLTPEEIPHKLHTPQPAIYRSNLDRVGKLSNLFREKGIDIMNLDRGYDFIALSSSGERTEWTMIPPVVERFSIHSNRGRLDYSQLIGPELLQALQKEGLGINLDVHNIPHSSPSGVYNLINDGAHRVHYGFENKGIKVLIVENIAPGFPYYATPQHYSTVRVFPVRDEKAIEAKIHIVQVPGHKLLYRVFPTGGIKTGELRPDHRKII